MQVVTQDDQNLPAGTVITLKEITDLLSVQHSKAMKTVLKLTKEVSFGEVSKMDTINLNGVKVETYALSKIQAIATAAKLDNAQLMKVVIKLEKPKNNYLQMDIHFKRIEALTDATKTIMTNVENLNERTSNLEKNQKIEHWQQKSLTDAKNKIVYSLGREDQKLIRKLHSRVWSLFKKKFYIPRYNELPSYKYENGLEFINNLTLSDMVD